MAGSLVMLGACMTWQLAGAAQDVADAACAQATEGEAFAAVSGVSFAWPKLPWADDAAAAVASPESSSSSSSSSLPPAPSGVNTLPEFQQAAIFFVIFAVLAVLVRLVIGPGFTTMRKLLPEGWFNVWQKTWPSVAGFYIAVGIAHFTDDGAKALESICPPPGTWGFWYIPGSVAFHVAWTGVAEIAGGAGLLLGALIVGIAQLSGNTPPSLGRHLFAASALGLFALTWTVTPANIFMFTHGVPLVGFVDAPIPLRLHAYRGVFQVVLLSTLWGCYEDAVKSPGAEAR